MTYFVNIQLKCKLKKAVIPFNGVAENVEWHKQSK